MSNKDKKEIKKNQKNEQIKKEEDEEEEEYEEEYEEEGEEEEEYEEEDEEEEKEEQTKIKNNNQKIGINIIVKKENIKNQPSVEIKQRNLIKNISNGNISLNTSNILNKNNLNNTFNLY